VVSSRKEGNIDGLKILIVSYLNEDLTDYKENRQLVLTQWAL